MIPFKILDCVPKLPQKKGKKKEFIMQAGGVKIRVSVEVFTDTRERENWFYEDSINYHLEFESVEREPRPSQWEGQPPTRAVENPLSETGYLSAFFSLSVDSLESYDFKKAVKRKIRSQLDAEEKRWLASKQMCIF